MRFQGKVTRWKDDQGFGFIAPNGGGEAVFVHIKAFRRSSRRPVDGDLLTYEVTKDAKGRARAEQVAFVAQRSPAPPTSPGRGRIWLALLFLVFVAGCAWQGKLPRVVLVFYVVASLLAFAAYAWDKSAARNDAWRTKESTLHLIALFGGWPGALLAQRLIRHKSRKQSFQVVFWLTVFLNCVVLGWLITAKGMAEFRTVLAVLVAA